MLFEKKDTQTVFILSTQTQTEPNLTSYMFERLIPKKLEPSSPGTERPMVVDTVTNFQPLFFWANQFSTFKSKYTVSALGQRVNEFF